MIHLSWKMARATMGAIGLLVLLFLLAACGSVSPTLLSNSLLDAQSHDAAGNVRSNYIAGYLTSAPGTYKGAEVDFTVPSFPPQMDGGPKVAYAAAVVGSGSIVDAGIYSYLDPSGNQINKAYWEFNNHGSGHSQTKDLSLTSGNGGGVVSTGDQITVFVNLDSNGASFSVYDVTTKDSGSYTLPGNNYNIDGLNAGCLVLVPVADPHPLPPADFGTVEVQHCRVALVDQVSTINIYQPLPVDMVNGSFSASPGPLLSNNGDFSVTWQNSQTQGN